MIFSWKNAHKHLVMSLLVTAAADALPDAPQPLNLGEYSPEVIHRNVLIIGGSLSGTYSDIKLRDLGKTLAVVEMKGVLSGHIKTCTDPVTGEKVDLGIIIFHVNNLVWKYFGRYQIPLTNVGPVSGMRKYYDSRPGKILPAYLPPTPNFMGNAAQLAKYLYLEVGFDLPNPVPADLLLSFGNFVHKYNIGDFVRFATVNVV